MSDFASPGLPARERALAILSAVLRKRRPLDGVLAEVLGAPGLAPRDGAFARAIATETLRRFGQLEALIRALVPKSPPPHKAGPTLEILLQGACELLFLKVAPHAAVDAANRLAQGDAKAVHFKSLINAVLRRVAAEGEAVIEAQDLSLNAPSWLWERWRTNFGEDRARAILTAHLHPPPLDLTLKDAASHPAIEGAVEIAPRRLRLSEPKRVAELPGFLEGAWWVQDFAASLPVRLFGDVAGKRGLDLCAAPGGKTMQLASLGARVVSVDSSPERIALVAENLNRTGLSAEPIVADARDANLPKADFVLLDAPCTATGTIRRHPDLPWIKGQADIGISCALQEELLDAAAELTAPGGTLVYAVCSLEPEEGAGQVRAFLRRRKDFSRIPVTAVDVFDAAFVSAEGDLTALPCHWADKGGMDGFFAARLRRAP